MMRKMMALADPKKLQDKLNKSRQESEEREAQRRASSLGYQYVDIRPYPVQIESIGLVEENDAREGLLAVISVNKKREAVVAVVDPTSSKTQSALESLKQRKYSPIVLVCSKSGLNVAWEVYSLVPKKSKKKITGEVSLKKERLEELRNKIKSLKEAREEISEPNNQSTSEMLELVLISALILSASDVHIEPIEKSTRIRYRIDGELNDLTKITPEIYSSINSRIKLLSHLKLNVKDEPQDGRFTIKTSKKNIEIRTSLIPSEYGETIVLRILDPDSIKVGLKDLGFRQEDLVIVEAVLKKPNGMILNTGPTGSGKTTTLYAFIKHVYSQTIKIITIEDPIEYHIEGISQTQVDSSTGYTFSSGLRSILRQDPDVILVGEIRDMETAEISMHAALTGHMVFSTLHTNQAAGSIPRLIDMGIKPPVIAPALNLVIAQRLIRKLCNECKTKSDKEKNVFDDLISFTEQLPKRVKPISTENVNVFNPSATGCSFCHKGYKGRIGVFELFIMNEEIEKLMSLKATESEIKKAAINNGMLTMQQDGILKVMEGITSFEEVRRATGPLPFDN